MSIPTSAITQLSVRLQKAGRSARTGSGWLSTLAIASLTVCTWVCLIAFGGTWMFFQRARHPSAELAAIWGDSSKMLNNYVVLALFACIFVLPATLSLVAQSAVLGASGRNERLATLRLIGMSNGDVTRMTLIETGFQAIIGLVLGTLLSVVTAPAWAALTFQGLRIGTWEMLLPWWGYPIVWVALFLLALLASVAGLKRVLISPLGVSKREIPKAMRAWRLILFAVIVVAGLSITKLKYSSLFITLIVMALVFLGLILAINIVAPWIIQLVAKLSSMLPGAANFVATRRVATNGRAAWQRCSAITFLSVLLGYTAFIPRRLIGDDIENYVVLDIRRGIVVAFFVGLVVSLMSMVLNQSFTVFDQASLTRSLDFIGTKPGIHNRIAMKQTFYPLLVVSGFGFLFGMGLSFMSFSSISDEIAQSGMIASAIAIAVASFAVSIVLAVLVTASVNPLRRGLLNRQVRAND